MIVFPADIDLIATNIVRMQFPAEVDSDWEQYRAIAAALLAERERCASIARHLNGWGADKGAGGHAEHIAKIIMGSSS